MIRNTPACRARIADLEGRLADLQGSPGTPVVAREINPHHTAQQRLAENEANLQALIDAMDESILLISPDGTILNCNETLAVRFGKPRKELIGLNAYGLVPQPGAVDRRAFADQALQSGAVVHFIDECIGQVFENTVYPVSNGDGLVTLSGDRRERYYQAQTNRR